VSGYLANRSSGLENKTKHVIIKQKTTTSSQREDDKRNNAHTRQKKKTAEESCRGGWPLSTVSLRNLGNRDELVDGYRNSSTSNSKER
jgi:hypothetical protein